MASICRPSIHNVIVLCFATGVSMGLGCAQANMLRDRAALSGRAIVDAVAPVLDPAGGAVSAQGRAVEQSLSRAGGY